MLAWILSEPVTAQPSLPLPPAPLPGTPDPLYWVSALNQPFIPLVLSILLPGAAIQRPAIPPETMLILKFANGVLLKAKVKY